MIRSLLDRLNSVRVCLQYDLERLPPLVDITPLYLREMNMRDEAEVTIWLDIHNDAFGRAWGPAEYESAILRHPMFLVTHTYFVIDGRGPIGAGSMGINRKNEEIGIGHYLQVRGGAQGLGVGKYLALYRLHRLKELGLRRCEIVTTLRHRRSLFIHFDCGAKPKLRLDYWNDLGQPSALARRIVHYRLNGLYREWMRDRRTRDS